MVGIVLVSHSASLVSGVKELADQMVEGKVPLATAGGIDDPENPIGTDAMKVLEAIETVYSDDGVVVLMDLGSAILSAELALEFLDPAKQAKVALSTAPFVEGALAAVVQASVGGTMQQVLVEAQGALATKVDQLQVPDVIPDSPSSQLPPTSDMGESIKLIIHNQMGLHARPAAKFVSTANQFSANILINKGAKHANAKSINQVAVLGVRQGEEIEITAFGVDAIEALEALKNLVDENFGEDLAPIAPQLKPEIIQQESDDPDLLLGIAASPGIAIGPAFLYRPVVPAVVEETVTDPDSEWSKLKEAIEKARQEIVELHKRALQQIGAGEAAIFEAHTLFLQDPVLLDAVRTRIFSEKINAEAAWEKEITSSAASFRELKDPYMQARAADIEDIGQRVLRLLLDVELPSMDFENPSILVARDLSPSDTAQLDPARVLGICTEMGGATSHSAILARALGLPAIVGLGQRQWEITAGQTIALDGESGKLWLQPDENQIETLKDQRQAWQTSLEQAKEAGQKPAVTLNGHRVEIAANIGGQRDIQVALEYGAEGVGLFRTEFLFMDRQAPPTEEEQFQAYRQVARTLGKRPLIIRTLDVGGDKPLPYFDLGEELNPFLGWRGIRFCLDHPDIFLPQLRAILRASSGHNVKIMFPMIGTVNEIRQAKKFLDQARADLEETGLPYDHQMEVGIMIEVPSAVALADQLANEVDFFSIGTNDLTQYTMAADRGNANVAGLAQALQPAVLRMIQQTVTAGHAGGIWVGMCGELAGNALAAPLLIGLGLDELSMSAPSIPLVKEAVRKINSEAAQEMLNNALSLSSAADVLAYLS